MEFLDRPDSTRSSITTASNVSINVSINVNANASQTDANADRQERLGERET